MSISKRVMSGNMSRKFQAVRRPYKADFTSFFCRYALLLAKSITACNATHCVCDGTLLAESGKPMSLHISLSTRRACSWLSSKKRSTFPNTTRHTLSKSELSDKASRDGNMSAVSDTRRPLASCGKFSSAAPRARQNFRICSMLSCDGVGAKNNACKAQATSRTLFVNSSLSHTGIPRKFHTAQRCASDTKIITKNSFSKEAPYSVVVGALFALCIVPSSVLSVPNNPFCTSSRPSTFS
jgi:hypothetical protein